MLRIAFIYILLLPFTVLFAQNSKYLETLKKGIELGQQVPDVKVERVMNYKDSILQLGDFKGKLVIIDFWNTACGSCIAAFPELDTLQKKFSDKLQIIAVNDESFDATKKFIKKFKINLPDFPFVTGDTVISNLFPHHFVPHHVWISGAGEVLEFTGGRNTNEATLKKYFEGKELNLYQVQYVEDANPESPIRDVFKNYIGYYSVITHTSPSVGGFDKLGSSRPGSNTINLLAKKGAAIIELFRTAYAENGKYNFKARNSILLTGLDSIAYFYPTADSLHDYWLENNCYNYDLVVPENLSDRLFLFMQQDLSRYFGVRVGIVLKKQQAIVIQKKPNKNSGELMNLQKKDSVNKDSVVVFRRGGMKAFVSSIQNAFVLKQCPLPVVDKTGYLSDVFIKINRSVYENLTVEGLNAELAKYGLQAAIKAVKCPILVIKRNS